MLKLDQLTDDERDQFMELIHESLRIKSHFKLYLWLQGPLQQLLPHDILIAAWGDFSIGLIHYDVISELPGVRTKKINNDNLTRLLKRLFTSWESNGCRPALLGIEECINPDAETGRDVIGRDFRDMKSVLIHAIKDCRERNDCLYVLMSKTEDNPQRACTMLEALLPHIDTTLRKVPHLPEQITDAAQTGDEDEYDPERVTGITQREAEIMTLVRVGKTNIEIGMILDISAFTVKNHLKHIFKKLNVSNRAQAVSKFQKRHQHQLTH